MEDISAFFNCQDDYERYLFALQVDSDLLKLECLKYIHFENYLAVIIASLKNDDNKLAFLKDIRCEEYRYLIIKSLQTDYLKIQMLSFLDREEYRFKIIYSFFDDDNKEKYLLSISSFFYRAKIIASFHDDERKKKYIPLARKGGIVTVVISFSNDLDKLPYLSLLQESEHIQKVLCSLKSDELKYRYLNLISDEEYRILVIASMQDIDFMIQGLNEIQDYIIKISIIDYVDEEVICKLISKTKGKLQLDLICSLKSDETKLQWLNILVSTDRLTLLFGMSDEIKERYIGSFDTYEENMALIYSLQNLERRDYYRMKYEEMFRFDLGIDSNLIFGLEIELEGVNAQYFNYSDDNIHHYRGTLDGTLIQGIEIKTPKLTNRSLDLRELYYVCNMLHYAGLQPSLRTGGHIHFDEAYFDSKEAYLVLFEIWSYTENILCLISNPIYEIPRKDISGFAKPFVQSLYDPVSISKYLEENDHDFISHLYLWQEDKHNGLNLTHVGNGTHTIEFRIANGVVSFQDWVCNIRLFGRLMMVSKMLAHDYQEKESTKKWQLKEQLKQSIPEKQKLEILLTLLFSEKEKDIYEKRYWINKKIMEKEVLHPFHEMKFEGWDYQRIRKIKD